MNTELLLQVADRIAKHPEALNMFTWIKQRDCNTTACIAGWAVLLAGGSETRAVSVSQAAAAHLGLNHQECFRLFTMLGWPNEFCWAYMKAYKENDAEAMASIACERIHHFIKTEGQE